MRKLLLLSLAMAAIVTPALCVTRHIQIVAPYRAGQAQGNVVAVRGRAEIRPDITHPGTDVRLVNEEGRVVFIGFVPKLNEYDFPQLADLDGKTVVMWGVIEIYQGLPATQLITRNQLRAA